uniref:Gypsy retrotransposon integrase-like protein 1 n=1 Tax=Nothobranchius pienaari TaxID=704102 RepID=A0A1A8L2U7_9TELE
MDSSGVPAPRMDWDSANLPDAWRRFVQHVKLMLSGPLSSKSEETQCSYLLLWVGERGRDIYNTWQLSEEEAKKLTTYLDRFEQYLMPKTNTIFARYKFNKRLQGEGESFEHFVTELKLLVKQCGYENSDEMVRDRIVFATSFPQVREKLLSQGSDLTLEKAIDMARSYEIAQTQLKAMVDPHTNLQGAAPTHAVSTKRQSTQQKHRRAPHHDKMGKVCGRCARAHSQKEECPAKGRSGKKCNKMNHFAKACRSEASNQRNPVCSINPDTPSEEAELFIDSITKYNEGEADEQAYADVEVGSRHHIMSFKLDTGATANVIPARLFKKRFKQVSLAPPTRTLSGYGGEKLNIKGTCQLKCRWKDIHKMLTFDIVETAAPPILGLRACLDLNLVKLVMSVQITGVMEEFADVFKGIGKFPGECDLHIDPDATPVVCPPRRIPFTLRERLKQELDDMEKNGIIIKVKEPTEWVNGLVVAEKRNGNLRVCLDPRELNKAIKRPHYPLPTLDDITPKLAGAQYFRVMDARSGYWAIQLTTKSSLLTTFNTIFGRYRFLHLPFGIISAQDIFQRKIDETYEGLNGVVAIVDDILVFGRTKEEHDDNLRAMLERTRERGVRLNPEKCVIGATEVSYFGHKLTREGIQPDQNKLQAIKDMPPPENKNELETILGMANYLSRFAPRLSEVNAPLRQLLKQDSEFIWDQNHDRVFQQMKDLITREPGPILAYYDTTKEIRLQVVASKYGLGAVLMQDGHPIAYASKTLTPTEVNYAQIEKELFAVLFGCKRFHTYIYGRRVLVESDHKPLEHILKKPISVAPARLQRMLLQLQRYDIKIVHRPGKDIPVADTLSRKPLLDQDSTLSEGMEDQIHSVINSLPVSDKKLSEIQAATRCDPQLTLLRQTVQDGWPEDRKKCPKTLLDFWNFRDEISHFHGIIFKGDKIIVPTAPRNNMLERIHTGHMGIERSKQRVRDALFWPGMGRDITATVENCSICQERRAANPKEPLIPHQIPETMAGRGLRSLHMAWTGLLSSCGLLQPLL